MNNPRHCPGKRSLRLIKDKQCCNQCCTLQHCAHVWQDSEITGAMNLIMLDGGSYQAGHAIYRMEDRFRSLFVVQSGLVKVEKILEDGTNHVTGFYFGGDMFGLKSIGCTRYGYDAVALEATTVCEIPYDKLVSLAASLPRLQSVLISLLGEKMQQMNNLLLNGRRFCAEKRLLLFLKGLCERNLTHTRGNMGRLHLPMTKTDIASYLGIRPESVSRALANLQRQGVIRNHLRYIEIDDIDFAMQAMGNS